MRLCECSHDVVAVQCTDGEDGDLLTVFSAAAAVVPNKTLTACCRLGETTARLRSKMRQHTERIALKRRAQESRLSFKVSVGVMEGVGGR